jgi:peptidoglycan hydrolase-like protein with peptidoglycan-binding domain
VLPVLQCYRARKRTQNIATALVAVGIFAGVAIFTSEKPSTTTQSIIKVQPPPSTATGSPSSQPIPSIGLVRTVPEGNVRPVAPQRSLTKNIAASLQDVSEVIRVQTRLVELGYLNGPADGVWGSKSRTALRSFKEANRLPKDDTWDQLTAEYLFAASAARAPLNLSPPLAFKSGEAPGK